MKRKIVLLCCAGMSTSILVKNMKKAAEDQGYDAEIAAHSVSAASDHADAEVVLLGPQVRYAKKKVTQLLPNVKVADIDMKAYGKMDGAAVLEQAKKLLGDA